MNELSIEIQRDIAFPRERVWSLLADFGNLGWMHGFERVEVIGAGIGMTRRIHMAKMEPIDEVLEGLDAVACTLRYSIPRGMPLPVRNYHATVRLEALPGNHTRVHWSARAEAAANMDVARQSVEGAYVQMIGWIEAHLARQ